MSGNIISLDERRAEKARQKLSENVSATVLLGADSGTLCPHCHGVLKHAMLVPQGNEGKACVDCSVWFDGDIYRG